MGVLDSVDEVHHPLQTEPEHLHAELAIALPPQESAEKGDQAGRVSGSADVTLRQDIAEPST
jgi:hypothetical protein